MNGTSGSFFKGLTIIEVIMILAIFSIVTSIAVVGYITNQDVLLKKCAYKLAADIRNIQMKTVYEKETRYRIYANSSAMPDGYRIMLGSKIIEEVKFDQGITYVSSYNLITSNYLTFSLNGAPNYGGTFTLRNKKGKGIKITVVPSTGRVRIMDADC